MQYVELWRMWVTWEFPAGALYELSMGIDRLPPCSTHTSGGFQKRVVLHYGTQYARESSLQGLPEAGG